MTIIILVLLTITLIVIAAMGSSRILKKEYAPLLRGLEHAEDILKKRESDKGSEE